MKKGLLFFVMLALACSPVWAQGKTAVRLLGKDKGTVSSLQAGGHTLVDAQATAKKLGGSVELFSASKQIKIAFPGMYAILGAPLREAIINTVTVPLPTEVIASGGRLYAPVEFFMLPQVQKALDRQITFEKNTLVVERNYNVFLDRAETQKSYDKLYFQTKGQVTVSAEQTDKHTVKILFEKAVLKREVNQRPKTDFIRSVTVTQRGGEVQARISLGAHTADWKLLWEKGQPVFISSANAIPDIAPSTIQTAIEKSSDDLLPPPSVQGELSAQSADENAEELDLSALSDDEELPQWKPAKETPVISPLPSPTVTAAALPVLRAKKDVHIMIDPGHGGKDPGATRRGSAREKELNLNVSKHLYNYLKKQGFDVKLTRSDDTFVTLAGRSKMANEFKADLFISVHTNATKRSDANGFEVYFRSDKATDKEAAEIAAFENESLQYEEAHYSFVDKLLQSLAKNEYMNESSTLAGHVRNYVYKEPGIGIAVRQNNSIKQANFYVLRGVQAPAILVEMGFISSPKDRARLNNKSAQKKMGEGIGKGVVAYLKSERKVK